MKNQEEQWLLTEKYGGEKTDGFFADCERLAAGEPLGYVIGWTPFLNCKIWLDSHPLIPRPETEFWVEKAITEIRKYAAEQEQASPRAALGLGSHETVGQNLEQPRSDTAWSEDLAATRSARPVRTPYILDLCAGSGCIGVAAAKAIPEAFVDFAEIDDIHFPTILKNLQENQVSEERCTLIQSDALQSVTKQYDFILSNPPYIDPALDRTETSVKAHEPHLALYGGAEGMQLIARIIEIAPKHLTPGGQLWLEHEPEQVAAIHQLAEQHNFVVATHTDQYNLARYSVLTVAQ